MTVMLFIEADYTQEERKELVSHPAFKPEKT
jgi:hypothetical protein